MEQCVAEDQDWAFGPLLSILGMAAKAVGLWLLIRQGMEIVRHSLHQGSQQFTLRLQTLEEIYRKWILII